MVSPLANFPMDSTSFLGIGAISFEEYNSVGIPMMPGVKGARRTLIEMKVYSIFLLILAVFAPIAMGGMDRYDTIYHVFGWTSIIATLRQNSIQIDPNEPRTASGRIPYRGSLFLCFNDISRPDVCNCGYCKCWFTRINFRSSIGGYNDW